MVNAERQLTLVAYLEDRPPELTRLLAACRDRLRLSLGDDFVPSASGQIHATLVGLERIPGTQVDNANLRRLEGRRAPMDIRGYLDALLGEDLLPLEIRVGGFRRDQRPFESRGASPWQRSFSIQGDRAVLLGWPVAPGASDRFPPALDRLRRRAGDFNILHAYHAAADDVDNDLYLRLGTVRRGSAGASRVSAVETEVRDLLAGTPATFPLAAGDLRIAAYRDASLPPSSTRAFSLDSLTAAGSGRGRNAALEALYQGSDA